MPIPHDGTAPLRRALERRIKGSDATVSRLSDELEELDDAVRAAFQAGMQNVMRLVPAHAAPMAERALRSLIQDRVATALDLELDTAEQIRADMPETTRGAQRAQQECSRDGHCGCAATPCCACGATAPPAEG